MDETTPQQMYADAAACRANLRLEKAAVRAVSSQAPSLRYEDFPRDVAKREIAISDAATRLANALYLHLD